MRIPKPKQVTSSTTKSVPNLLTPNSDQEPATQLQINPSTKGFNFGKIAISLPEQTQS